VGDKGRRRQSAQQQRRLGQITADQILPVSSMRGAAGSRAAGEAAPFPGPAAAPSRCNSCGQTHPGLNPCAFLAMIQNVAIPFSAALPDAC
jgi:hypothetical protein